MPEIFYISLVFTVVAALYSSVGFGGGSSYIAILLMTSAAVGDVRFIALICNIIVVSVSTFRFTKERLVPWSKIWPILLFSIPLSYLGASIIIDPTIYRAVAACTLIVAGLLLLKDIKSEQNVYPQSKVMALASIGGVIGFVSGLIGIGGGIFLSPVLHLSHWDKAIKISATTSVFILVNSIAGIVGQWSFAHTININELLVLVLSVFFGGQIGNYISIKNLEPSHIKILTAVLILFVGIRILVSQIA